MRKYKYKETGIEWLGELPEHWIYDRLRDVTIINDKTLSNQTPSDFEFHYLDIGNVDYNGIINSQEIQQLTFEDSPSRARRVTKKYDTVISSVRTNLQAVAYLDLQVDSLIVSTGFFVCRPKFESLFDNKYLYYFLLTDYSKDFFFSRSVGVSYPAINDYKFGSIYLPIPPIKEQKSIAEYLDKACQGIDKAINIKKKQIKSLEMHKESKLFELLTRGFDKKVKLKPSEISWINTIPEDWKRKRVKDVVFLQSGDSITSEDINSYDTYPVYGGNGLRGYTSSYTHEGEFILIGRQGALCGNVNYADGKFWASEHAVVATPIKNFNTLWLGELLRVMNLNQYSNAAAQPGLAVEKIKNLCIPFPPIDIQNKIADYLKVYLDKNTKLANKLNEQLDNLKSYRKSIIHECVTGKKQVADIAVEKIIKRAMA